MDNPDAVHAVYLTFPDADMAESIARTLVERRLAACVNVLPVGRSIYRWDDEIITDYEVVAIAKTTRRCLSELVEAVKELHPYDLPGAIAYKAAGGLAEYLEWVGDETA